MSKKKISFVLAACLSLSTVLSMVPAWSLLNQTKAAPTQSEATITSNVIFWMEMNTIDVRFTKYVRKSKSLKASMPESCLLLIHQDRDHGGNCSKTVKFSAKNKKAIQERIVQSLKVLLNIPPVGDIKPMKV